MTRTTGARRALLMGERVVRGATTLERSPTAADRCRNPRHRRVTGQGRTSPRLLGDEYRVEASIGHVRDLPENASEVPAEIKDKPWGRMGVDVDNGFRPYYVIARDKAGGSASCARR